MTELKITSIASLKKRASATAVVNLPGWDDGEPFVCRLQRSQLRTLMSQGKIPNPLMAAAQRLYEGSSSNAKAKYDDVLQVMEIIVKGAMVQPTYNELLENDVELTEQQFSAIFSYAQGGIKAAERFLFKPADSGDGEDSMAVEDASE